MAGASAFCAHAATPNHFELSSPWEGIVRHGATTEITAAIETDRQADVLIRVSSDQGRTEVPLRLQSGVVSEATIPVLPPAGRTVKVSVRGDDEILASREYAFEPPSRARLIAVAIRSEFPLDKLRNPRAQLLLLDATALPKSAAAYQAIDMLVIDLTSLSRLSREQQSALEHYMAGCGRVIAFAMPPDVEQQFGRSAGCQQVSFRAARHINELVNILGDDQWQPPARLPAHDELTRLFPPTDNNTALTLFLFVSGYFAVVLTATVLNLRAMLISGVAGATTLLALLLWYLPAPRAAVAVWAERDVEAPLARYSAIVKSTGTSHGIAQLALPVSSNFPLLQGGRHSASITTRLEADTAVVGMPSSLLSQSDYVVNGTQAISSDLELDFRSSEPLVTNRGNKPTSTAALAWRGNIYRIPPLQPGDEWLPGNNLGTFSDHTAGRLLMKRAPKGSAALLVPLTAHDFGPAVTGSLYGWLMLSAIPIDSQES